MELIGLTRTLELSQRKNDKIYTDSKYAYLVVHAHGTIWKERRLLTSWDKAIEHAKKKKKKKKMLKFLEAMNLLNQIATMHFPGH